MLCFFISIQLLPISTLMSTLFPVRTLFRSAPAGSGGVASGPARGRADDRATAGAHHDGTTVGGGEPARAQRLAGDEAARLVGPPARIDNPDAAGNLEHWLATLAAALPRLTAGAFGRYPAHVSSDPGADAP